MFEEVEYYADDLEEEEVNAAEEEALAGDAKGVIGSLSNSILESTAVSDGGGGPPDPEASQASAQENYATWQLGGPVRRKIYDMLCAGGDAAAEQKDSVLEPEESQASSGKGKRKRTRKVEKSRIVRKDAEQRWNYGKLL